MRLSARGRYHRGIDSSRPADHRWLNAANEGIEHDSSAPIRKDSPPNEEVQSLPAWYCFSLSTGSAQQPATPKARPKLGLALQGGGALGLAHVGVITWMEEHHIPVDYVAGTSMGGLVGGVYATGRNATELRQVVNGINWDEVMAGQTPFDDLSFRRKEDARDYPNSLEFGLRNGIAIPFGIQLRSAGLADSRPGCCFPTRKSRASTISRFPSPASPPIWSAAKPRSSVAARCRWPCAQPCRCPVSSRPVRDDGAIYADGGLLENLPVRWRKKWGLTWCLGVHLAEETLKPDANLSSFAVLGQSISVMISANELQSMEMADILLSVPVQKWGALSFDDADAIIKAGYDAAQAKSKVLLTLAVDDATWNEYIAERNSRRITTTSSTDLRRRTRGEYQPVAKG